MLHMFAGTSCRTADKRDAASVFDLEDLHVLIERVDAGQVVVVFVAIAPDYAARLGFPGRRLVSRAR